MFVIYPRIKFKVTNTVDKLISLVSSVFRITEESLIDTFEDETNTCINPMEQLIQENEHLIKDLENEY